MRKLNVTVLVGLLVALIGFGMVFVYGSRVDSRVAEGKQTVAVLVAGDAVQAGALASDLSAQVAVKKVPRLYVAEGALADLTGVQGKVLLGPLGKGTQLTAAMFGEPGSGTTVTAAKGRVALALGVALTPGVARYVTPGSAVDLFVTYSGGSAAGGGSSSTGDTAAAGASTTKLFASGVRVMSVRVADPSGASDDAQAAPGADAGQVVAVLDLSPREAEKVVNATTLGSIYLALASSQDGKPHTTGGVTPADVLGSNR
ncbi:MAG: Flp pilus assembly protein CpaB [Frankiales bacterium]|nr:Flp pilus assembly protein CpaB [Frankiales bacterium]